MSVRFKYAGDKDISAGRSSGASLFTLPGGVSFPEAGTILETLTGQEYPESEGGGGVEVNSVIYPSQTADVYRKADGSGGSYLDWASAFNIAYKANGVTIVLESGTYNVTIGTTSYSVGSYQTTYYHDGVGGFYTYSDNYYDSYGTLIPVSPAETGLTSYVNVNGVDYANGTYDLEYYSDGVGSYYSSAVNTSYTSYGSFIVSQNSQTEVPSASSNYFDNGTTTEYYHDGSGSWYTSVVGSYYNSGDYITNYSGTDYYWDGSGGYYS